MILVDTSVWIDHLRRGEENLTTLLNGSQVLVHPLVLGELACSNLANRDKVLGLLNNLPRPPVATDNEVLMYIEQHTLMGQGIGYIDVHLLASVALEGTARLWTRDKRLRTVAKALLLAATTD